MSKKKSLTTMTLKDFHGGSIPSELPLPSAPGVSARPPDRPAISAAAASSRSDHLRSRGAGAASASAAAAAAPAFLTHPSRIGRHFDEDERTPFEAAAPRRPAAPSPTPSPSPAPAPAAARSDLRAPFPAAGGGSGNAWAARREVGPTPAPAPSPAAAAGGGQIWSATRIAQASAVEKVISGKWHSKPSSPPLDDAPDRRAVAPPPEMERPRSVGYPGLSSGTRDSETGEQGAPPARPASHEGRVGERRVEEVPERPKLKLLPRSKPIEASEPPPAIVEEKQVHQVPAIVVQVQTVHDVPANVGTAKTSVAGADAESRAAERPRLNLRPRSHTGGQSDEIAARERQSLFGGARPRELVLKERGIDVAASDLEKTSPVGRAKNDLAKIEAKVESVSINPSGEKVESFPSGQRGPRNVDRKDYRRDADRVDAHRPSRRDDNRRAARDVEKPPEQLRPEPETWRKPMEPLKAEVPGPRFGKAATALELAQAFSKSVSDTVPQSRLTSAPTQRVAPSPGGRDQVGFSRLTDNRALHSGPAQRKINGY